MRVLHVSPYFAPAWVYGGPPRSVLGLCQGLQAAGIDIEVVTTVANGDRDLPASPAGGDRFEGVPVRYAPRAFPRRFFGAAVRQPIAAALERADLCHIHGLWNVPAWQAALAARRAGVPTVISPRGMLQRAAFTHGYWRKRIAFELIERRSLNDAVRLHATTDDEAETLRGMFGTSRVVVIPNGVAAPAMQADPDFRARHGIPVNAPLIVFLGRMHPIKRLDLLAGAMQTVVRSHPEARLVLAGPDEGGHLASLKAAFRPLERSMRIVGELEERAKWSLLREAAALVLCSDSENFGLSVAEALAVGCPVVVSRTCPWAALDEHRCGLWVPQTPEAIAVAIASILDEPAEAAARARRGIALVRRRYDWRAIGHEMAACYADALGRRKTA
jgi:glycosyltransferase involved in cell wall biosynthesis